MSNKVYDCFTFNGEWEMLTLRLHTHDPHVDHFVIAEGDHTQTGVEKKFQFSFEHDAVQPFVHKIRYVPVTDLPNTHNAWDNENHLRDALIRGLWDAQDTDWIMVSDCDEIVRSQALQQLKHDTVWQSVGFQQHLYYCYLNNMQIPNPAAIIWGAAVRHYKVKITGVNACRWAQYEHMIPNAGWHFSYMMSVEQIQNKLRSIADTWVNCDRVINNIDPESCAQWGVDLLGRWYYNWKLLPIAQADLPPFVHENPHLFDKLLLEPDAEFARPRPRNLEHFWHTRQGWFTETDAQFYAWCVQRYSSPSHFVEVGSFNGRSSAFMAVEIINSGKQIQFDCVQTWQPSLDAQAHAQEFRDALHNAFVHNMQPVVGYYNTVCMSSVQAAHSYPDASLDMVYLDVSSHPDHVDDEIQSWWCKIKLGGILAGNHVHEACVQQVAHVCGGQTHKYGNTWYQFKGK